MINSANMCRHLNKLSAWINFSTSISCIISCSRANCYNVFGHFQAMPISRGISIEPELCCFTPFFPSDIHSYMHDMQLIKFTLYKRMEWRVQLTSSSSTSYQFNAIPLKCERTSIRSTVFFAAKWSNFFFFSFSFYRCLTGALKFLFPTNIGILCNRVSHNDLHPSPQTNATKMKWTSLAFNWYWHLLIISFHLYFPDGFLHLIFTHFIQ